MDRREIMLQGCIQIHKHLGFSTIGHSWTETLGHSQSVKGRRAYVSLLQLWTKNRAPEQASLERSDLSIPTSPLATMSSGDVHDSGDQESAMVLSVSSGMVITRTSAIRPWQSRLGIGGADTSLSAKYFPSQTGHPIALGDRGASVERRNVLQILRGENIRPLLQKRESPRDRRIGVSGWK